MPEQKIVYLAHPVSPETKAKHRAAGERIVDIRFAPEGYTVKAAPIAEPENVVEEKPKRRIKRKSKK